MKLYLVARTDEVDWDENRAAVVAAKSPKRAKDLFQYAEVEIKLIGTASPSIKEEGILLLDFKAG